MSRRSKGSARSNHCALCGSGGGGSGGGLAALKARERELLARHGFYAHYVVLASDYVNVHTHGIAERHPGQPDLQIVVPVPTDVAFEVFDELYGRIERGERFRDGDRIGDDWGDGVLLLRRAREMGRDVLRILFPAENGTLPGEPLHPPDFFPLQATLVTDPVRPRRTRPAASRKRRSR